MSILETEALQYAYAKRKRILRGVDVQLKKGQMYSILGPSGCGKTTLLFLLGGLDSPTAGRILYQGEDISTIGTDEYRRKNVAFIFQSYNLIEYLTAMENVALCTDKPPLPFLEEFGLTEKEATRSVTKLSGGQQQRVAIARALASGREIILADEPTGNLDEESARKIGRILKQSAHQHGKCVIIVTHSHELAKDSDVVFRLHAGTLVREHKLQL